MFVHCLALVLLSEGLFSTFTEHFPTRILTGSCEHREHRRTYRGEGGAAVLPRPVAEIFENFRAKR